MIPARAPVISERIETEFRTASGITDGKGHSIAGVVLITAGYSADGKYSHYFVSQVPLKVRRLPASAGAVPHRLGAGTGLTQGDVLPGAERETGGTSGSHAQSLHHPGRVFSYLAARRQGAHPTRPLHVQLRTGPVVMGLTRCENFTYELNPATGTGALCVGTRDTRATCFVVLIAVIAGRNPDLELSTRSAETLQPLLSLAREVVAC